MKIFKDLYNKLSEKSKKRRTFVLGRDDYETSNLNLDRKSTRLNSSHT